ncbi:hypothetical protein L1K69_23610, partial [Salmonella enterica subsp. enterica serovar Anatum]|nr:hypothetical protein [Salmonella enterica subsp. enterica serovar Anatum]
AALPADGGGSFVLAGALGLLASGVAHWAIPLNGAKRVTSAALPADGGGSFVLAGALGLLASGVAHWAIPLN